MIVRNVEEENILREGGQKLARILQMVAKAVKPGVDVNDLNEIAEYEASQDGDEAAFLGYKPEGATRPYPAGLCVSVNNEVVHGIPNEETKILKEGDIVTIDMGLVHKGFITDHALTVPVGEVDDSGKKLIKVTREALGRGIEKARAGNNVGEIGSAIEEFVKANGFVSADDLGGHGVGRSVHEEPYVPNIGPKDAGPKLRVGQVIAIEPIINEGGSGIYLDTDGYTFKTSDNKRSAQFEHTVLITEAEPVILTKLNN